MTEKCEWVKMYRNLIAMYWSTSCGKLPPIYSTNTNLKKDCPYCGREIEVTE